MQPTVTEFSLMDENRNEIEGNQVEVCVLNFHGLGLLEQFGVTIRGIRILIFQPFQELISPATVLYEMK
jgi:hypothetical protein